MDKEFLKPENIQKLIVSGLNYLISVLEKDELELFKIV